MTVARVRGFTLVEMVVVMAIMSIMAMLTTPNIVNEINQRRAEIAAEETQLIIDAARSYRVANGKWPGDATCSNAMSVMKNTSPPMLVGVGTLNKYNSPFSTSCTSLTFSVDQNAVADWDGYLANAVAATQVVDASAYLVRTTIGIPGSEPALDGKLSRLATGNAELNRMRTTLLLGGNNITEVNGLFAVSGQFSGDLTVQQAATIGGLLTAQGESQFKDAAFFDEDLVLNKVVAENSACSRTGAIARDSAGVTLSCQSGVWTGNVGIGYGQTWQLVPRALNTTYVNSTRQPIMIAPSIYCFGVDNFWKKVFIYVGGVLVGQFDVLDADGGDQNTDIHPATFIVPPGQSYAVTSTNTAYCSIVQWAELRL